MKTIGITLIFVPKIEQDSLVYRSSCLLYIFILVLVDDVWLNSVASFESPILAWK